MCDPDDGDLHERTKHRLLQDLKTTGDVTDQFERLADRVLSDPQVSERLRLIEKLKAYFNSHGDDDGTQ